MPKYRQLLVLSLFLPLLCSSKAFAGESTCYGTPSKGSLENGIKLRSSGANFSVYSAWGAAAGRTYVHSKVEEIVVSTYAALEQAAPAKHFVYGETGWEHGRRMKPHRTHQNGTSVDFMVPVMDGSGRSVPLPSSVANKFGYGMEFDGNGKSGGLVIDFEAMAEHLYALDAQARKAGASLALVIFDPALLPKLFKTRRGDYLRRSLPFMKGKAWIRHDEHFHVDFAIPCKKFMG